MVQPMKSTGQRRSVYFLRLMTALYAILYPYTFLFAFAIFVGAGPHYTNAWAYYSWVLIPLFLPVMMVVCIWKMWAYYVKAQYRRACWYAISPLAVLSIVFLCLFLTRR